MHQLQARKAYKITFFASLVGTVVAIAFVAYNGVSAWSGKSTSAETSRGSGSESPAPAPEDEKLVVTDSDLDMGTQYEADHYEHSFDVKNVSDQAITVAYWQRSCSCADVSPAGPLVFEPGETKKLTASFKLLPKKWSEDPSEGVLFSVRIYPTIRENDEDVKLGPWEFHCQVLPTIHFLPPVLNLGVHSEKEATIEGSADVAALLKVRSVECVGNARWDVDVQPPEGNRKSFRLKVRSKGTFQPEDIRETFTVISVRDDGESLPVKELMIVGQVIHDVVADPPQVLFGRQSCGGRGAETISLRSLTGRSFQVRSVVSDNEGLKVVPVEGGTGGTCKYSLSMGFVSEGKQNAVAKFVVQDSDGTEYELAVPLRYYGVKGR